MGAAVLQIRAPGAGSRPLPVDLTDGQGVDAGLDWIECWAFQHLARSSIVRWQVRSMSPTIGGLGRKSKRRPERAARGRAPVAA